MTSSIPITAAARTRAERLAAVAFVLAPLVTISLWLAGAEVGYDDPLFVWTHVSTLVSGILLALGATSLLYANGARRFGIAGLAGTAFAWVGVGASALWVPIAWQATMFAQTGASALSTFSALFSPLGSGYFVVVMFLYGLAVAGLALGLYGTSFVHRAAAGVGALVGGVSAIWMLYTVVAVLPETVTGVTIVLTILQWGVLLPLGISLYRRRGSTAASDDPVADAVQSAD